MKDSLGLSSESCNIVVVVLFAVLSLLLVVEGAAGVCLECIVGVVVVVGSAVCVCVGHVY